MENLLCLVSNGVQFSMGNGKDVTVSCSIEELSTSPQKRSLVNSVSIRATSSDHSDNSVAQQYAGKMLKVNVIDGGIGVPDHKKHSLFRVNRQGVRHTGGCGLGLFTLQQRVEQLGGCCGMQDRADGVNGSHFWFQIPYVPDSTVFEDAPSSRAGEASVVVPYPPNVSTTQTQGSKSIKNVLVVDDSLLIQKTCKRALSTIGLEISVASNGVECLEKVEANDYDLVLMDVQMPLMVGWTVTISLLVFIYCFCYC